MFTTVDIATGENINEALVAEGLAQVRGGGPEVARVQELENIAKQAGKGLWSTEKSEVCYIHFDEVSTTVSVYNRNVHLRLCVRI